MRPLVDMRPPSRAYRALFPRFERPAALRPTPSAFPSQYGIRIRWLGTAGFVIESGTTTLLIDPFLTRPSLPRLFAVPLVPDELAVRARVPERVDAVLCGHSHFDHLLDAPLIASITGASSRPFSVGR